MHGRGRFGHCLLPRNRRPPESDPAAARLPLPQLL